MWRQYISDKETTTELNITIVGTCIEDTPVDSGFLSWTSDEHSMRGQSVESSDAVELSESFIRNLSIENSNINNLETGKTQRYKHRTSAAIIEENANQRLDVKWNDVDRVDILKQSYEFFYRQDCSGDTQLHVSIVMKHVEAALWLIDLAPHPCLLDIANDDLHTALHVAVLTREPRLVRRLVLTGSNTRLRSQSGNTALHLACAIGDVGSARALLRPASPTEKAWMTSRSCEGTQMTGEDLELRNYVGETAVHIAAAKGYTDLVSELVHAGADVDARESLAGRTPLHLAIENNQHQVIQYLTQGNRCHLDAVTYAGCTAYRTALDVDPQLAADLLRLGASPCASSSSDETSSEEESF